MTARGKARKRALDILFESEQRRVDALETLADRTNVPDAPLNPYTVELVEGVTAERPELDRVIGAASREWPVDRMPAVDRTVLRIAVWELLHGEVPDSVAIDEAVELCKDLSTDESPAFVNGVLSRVLEERSTLPTTSQAEPSDGLSDEPSHETVVAPVDEGGEQPVG